MKKSEKKVDHVFRIIEPDGNRKVAARHNMNQKADKKLVSVAAKFEETIPENCQIKEEQFLCKVLQFQNCEPLDRIWLIYDIENRVAAISYNLLLQTFLEKKEERAYQFELHYDGVMQIQSLQFVSVLERKLQKSEREKEILQILNEPIILKKIKDLNLLEVKLQYSLEEKKWKISLKALMGSATWILIPPVMNLIQPKGKEIYTLVEIMRMLVSALR